MNQNINRRWLYLVLGTVSMLFAGIIYGWSILKAPFAAWWEPSQLALNFTITMTTFCIGGFLGAKISKRFGIQVAILAAAVLSCAGFMTASLLDGKNILMLYLTYGVLAGLGFRKEQQNQLAAKERYRERNKIKIAAYNSAYYQANKDEHRASKKAYREHNRESYNAYMRELRRKQKYKEEKIL